MNKSDRDLYAMFNGFFIIRLVISLFNVFEIVMCVINKPILGILCIILNVFYLLLYYNRIYLNIIAGVISFFIVHNIYESIVLGLAIGNLLSYIIDRIEILFMATVVDAGTKLSKK